MKALSDKVINIEAFSAGRADCSADEPFKEGQSMDYYRGYALEIAMAMLADDVFYGDIDPIVCSGGSIHATAAMLHKKLSEKKK